MAEISIPTIDHADKKCRLCGLADVKNTHIFHGSSKSLFIKVVTVFPLIMYEQDPLPKNICKKCVCNVNFMYNEILRAMRIQRKWINNVRSIQPNNDYIKILDLIEKANNVSRNAINARVNININEHCFNNFLLFNKTMPKPNPRKLNTKTDNTNVAKSCKNSSQKQEQCQVQVQEPKQTTYEIKDIKLKVKLNGCTLEPVQDQRITRKRNKDLKIVTTKKKKTRLKSETATENKEEQIHKLMKVKDEPYLSEDDDDDLTLSQIASTISNKSDSPAPPPIIRKCSYCPLQFKSIKLLAAHQIIHMRLSIPKICQKKYLHKSMRRGRLIAANDEKKCLRCLNCWRIFNDNKSILDHWTLGDCNFFCHICGKEFSQAPKMLREHVPVAHGISYRSSKMQRLRYPKRLTESFECLSIQNNSKIHKSLSELEPLTKEKSGSISFQTSAPSTPPTPTLTANPSKKNVKTSSMKNHNPKQNVMCPICYKVFNNLKAHMRIHKHLQMQTHKVQHILPDCTISTPQDADNTPSTSTTGKGIRVKDIIDLQSTIFEKIIPGESSKNSWISLPEVDVNNGVHIKEEPMETDNILCNSIAPITQANLYTIICNLCGQQFMSKLEELRHKGECSGNTILVCEYCNKKIYSQSDYRLHIKDFHNKNA